ncbi:hypothetical protein E2C01_098951 [Portunus trituberculatus]|uniref:Uncharacterized protein n=1 Tax=Portunus trituberculatus TaxID=210409 RepID=A0A5B7KE60_PORTR|nr:hypothetical protein [Portunus trituberculatus]
MSQVRRYGLKMSPFRTCYFRTFEKNFALRTSVPCLVVRRYGGAEVRTEVRKCPALSQNKTDILVGMCGIDKKKSV